MRKILLSALAATILFSAGLLASRAAAATASDPRVHVAAVICGGTGCNVVQTRGAKQKKLIWLGHG